MRASLVIAIIIYTATHICSSQSIVENLQKAGVLYFTQYEARHHKESFQEAIVILEKMHNQNPDNAMVKVLLGRLYIRKGKDSLLFWKKNEWACKGMTLMDEAVKQYPNNIFVAYERAFYFSQLPSFFKTWPYAKEELYRLADLVEKNSSSDILKDWESWHAFYATILTNIKTDDAKLLCLKQRIYYYIGLSEYKMRNFKKSQEMMNKVLKLDANSMYGNYAFLWLHTTVFR